jgi:hypothetical protein
MISAINNPSIWRRKGVLVSVFFRHGYFQGTKAGGFMLMPEMETKYG